MLVTGVGLHMQWTGPFAKYIVRLDILPKSPRCGMWTCMNGPENEESQTLQSRLSNIRRKNNVRALVRAAIPSIYLFHYIPEHVSKASDPS